MQRMLILTGLLTAAGLTAALNVTRETPDITARLPQPGGRDITVIIDDDGYIELRFWASPASTPSQITSTLTRAISVVTGWLPGRLAVAPQCLAAPVPGGGQARLPTASGRPRGSCAVAGNCSGRTVPGCACATRCSR